MHHESLLLNLAVCLAAALLCGWGAARLRFSPIVGYLVAGIICGPFTPGWVANPDIAEQLADMISIMLNPFLFRKLPSIERQLRRLPQWQNA